MWATGAGGRRAGGADSDTRRTGEGDAGIGWLEGEQSMSHEMRMLAIGWLAAAAVIALARRRRALSLASKLSLPAAIPLMREAEAETVDREAESAAIDAALLSSFRANSFARLHISLPAVRNLYRAAARMWLQPLETKKLYVMPEAVKTGVRGGAEYCNVGYTCIDLDKEYMRMRRGADGSAIPSAADSASANGSGASWSAADFEAVAMEAHVQLQAVGERVLDGLERALARESSKATLPSQSYLSTLLRYDHSTARSAARAVEDAACWPAERQAEGGNVTINLLRYVRKGAQVTTSPHDSGEVNAGIQPQGTGIPCAPHTDASLLTLIIAPSQPGLEVFATPHATSEAAAMRAIEQYLRGRSPDGKTAWGGGTRGEWLPGMQPDELTSLGEETEELAAEAADDTVPMTLVAMGGDMLVHATGGVLPPTRHRVTCWQAQTQRLSMIMGMYGADDRELRPNHFRTAICGLPPLLATGGATLQQMSCRESRRQKLYLDPEVQAKK